MKKKFAVVTLGCRTNQYESQAYADQLLAMGYTKAEEGEEAEICVVNTCTVTESADSSSRYQIRQLVKQHPTAQIVVTGCLADRLPKEVAQIPGVTHVVANQDKENLLQVVFPEESLPEFSITQFEAHTRAFVKVQDGCNSFCTYCIIPYVRGRSRSKDKASIVKEVKTLIQNGFKEVVLTGINIGDYDGGSEEEKVSLAELIREVDQIEGLRRLRVSSIDPDEVTPELADAILLGKNTCPSMHIVLQAGSNAILKRMNRKYTKQIFLETVRYLQNREPDFTFTTDIIVGFPGETEQDFEETLEVMREVKFAKVHMFPYSERPRTKAATYKNKVPSLEIQRRKQIVLRLSEELSFSLREKYLGKEREVLLEKDDSSLSEYITGHTDNFLPVLIRKQEGLSSNQIVKVRFVANEPEGLVGEILKNDH